MTTAFVLSGGASLGAVQVGMLQALAERQIEPDLLVATSVGAFNAAWVAGKRGTLEELAAVWRGLRRDRLFPVDRVGAVLGILGRRNYLCPNEGLRDLLQRHLAFRRLEEASIPLHVVATELRSGREVCLSQGDATAAILASSAIPGIYPPVRIGGRDLVDGGVSSFTPVSLAVALGATRVYVLPTGYACALGEPPSSALGMALHALTLVVTGRLQEHVQRMQSEVELHVLPPLCPLSVSPVDFGHADELIRRSHSDSRDWLSSSRPHPDEAAVLAFHPPHRKSGRRARPRSTG